MMTTPIEAEVVESEPQTKNGNGKKRSLAKREAQSVARKEPEPGSIEDLMVRAVEQGNMDVIERVFELSEKARRERARSAFFEGMSRFQSLVPKIPKTKAGYGYFYAPLGEIEKHIKPHLETCGLSKRWEQVETPDSITLSCIVTHSEGHSERTTIGPVPWDLLERTPRMNSLQHRSAVITYLQRYTEIGALGLATADDDPDGVIPEEARAQQAEQKRQPVSQPQPKPTAQKKAAAAKTTPTGERPQIEPAAEGEAVAPGHTLKAIRGKLDSATLSVADFKKRFPAFKDLEDPLAYLPPSGLNICVNWIADPSTH